jgi:PAS domain S-box-containing protein
MDHYRGKIAREQLGPVGRCCGRYTRSLHEQRLIGNGNLTPYHLNCERDNMQTSEANIERLRRKAESYLRNGDHAVPLNPSATDTVRLMHELQVHQVELQLQYDELRHAHLELEESRNRYVELYESIPIGYFSLTPHGAICDVNPVGAAMLRQPMNRLIGRRFHLFMPVAQRRRFIDFCKQVCFERQRVSCEVDLGDASEEQPRSLINVLLEGSPAQGHKDILRVAVIDITRRKQAEQQLQQNEDELRTSRQKLQDLNAQLLNIQDEERKAIARELHDNCCQQLAMMMFSTNSIERSCGEPQARKVRLLAEQIKRTLESVRHIAYGLHPAMWETTGIQEAMRSYLADFVEVTELPVDFQALDVPDHVPEMISTCLFRTLQEVLHNVVKYAEASRVEVRLIKRGESISLSVTDHGRGFQVGTMKSSPRGLGLVSLKERAQLLHGTLDVTSEIGVGTMVHIRLPLVDHSNHHS